MKNFFIKSPVLFVLPLVSENADLAFDSINSSVDLFSSSFEVFFEGAKNVEGPHIAVGEDVWPDFTSCIMATSQSVVMDRS